MKKSCGTVKSFFWMLSDFQSWFLLIMQSIKKYRWYESVCNYSIFSLQKGLKACNLTQSRSKIFCKQTSFWARSQKEVVHSHCLRFHDGQNCCLSRPAGSSNNKNSIIAAFRVILLYMYAANFYTAEKVNWVLPSMISSAKSSAIDKNSERLVSKKIRYSVNRA